MEVLLSGFSSYTHDRTWRFANQFVRSAAQLSEELGGRSPTNDHQIGFPVPGQSRNGAARFSHDDLHVSMRSNSILSFLNGRFGALHIESLEIPAEIWRVRRID